MKRMYNGVEVTYQNETDYSQSNVVYLITFPGGKNYVGSTTKKLHQRISIHCVDAVTHPKQFLISFAIREFMKFDIKILDTENDKNKLRKLEEFYTIEYRSNENEFGYNNMTGNSHSDETKVKMSEIANNMSEEHKLKISKSKKGIMFSEEHKLKLSKSKSLCCFDDFNNHFQSMQHAADYYKCSKTYIWGLLKSGKKSKKLGTKFYYL